MARDLNGIAGLRIQRTARSTGTLVGLYHAQEAGIEEDMDTPWATVCEPHGFVVCHATRRVAESWIACPEQWCEECRKIRDAKDANAGGVR